MRTKTSYPEKWAKFLKNISQKGCNKTENKHISRCSISDIINELQIKTTMRYFYAPTRMTKMLINDHTKSC
jgi:hypothetical protein